MGIFSSKSISNNYNSKYISKSYLNDYEKLSNVYKRFYRTNMQGNGSLMCNWVELLITQPIQTFIISDLNELNGANIGKVKENMNILVSNFKKVFTSDQLNNEIGNLQLNYKEFNAVIDKIITIISNRDIGNNLITVENSHNHRDLLRILKRDVEKLRTDVSNYIDSYEKSGLFYRFFIDVDWRCQNYKDFIDNEINSFALNCEIKIREIESAFHHFEKIIEILNRPEGSIQFDEMKRLILNNFGYIFKEYRTRTN